MNELTILVENLGFDKGFSGDTNNPRGLVTFETVPQTDVEFYIDEKLSVKEKVDELLKMALLSGGYDNITIALIKR